MDPATLSRLSPRVGDTGVLLGREAGDDSGGRAPVLLPMLRAEPTRLVLIGGLWLTRIVVFRCLALGTRVLVRTADPRRWDGLGAAAANAPGRVSVVTAGEPVHAHAGEPVLHVADLDGQPAGELTANDHWQTVLTVASQLTAAAAGALATADAALLQRMWPQQASYVTSLMRVDSEVAQSLAALPDDAAVLIGRGSQRRLRLAPTALEQRLFGPPQRA
jgi:hypothetical protein